MTRDLSENVSIYTGQQVMERSMVDFRWSKSRVFQGGNGMFSLKHHNYWSLRYRTHSLEPSVKSRELIEISSS